jgi:hypothetical protein
MAGTISLSLSQRLNQRGEPLAGGKLYLYAAGTTTPQNAFQDAALTIPLANPYTLDAAGNIPQFFLADGQIKVVLTDNLGVTQLFADNVLVIGPSSGGGGGGSVDPTTILQVGFMMSVYGTGVITGFVRVNARTIGNAVSGATERANSDTQNLFSWLWNADANLTVSGGRGASALADYNAGKTITLPDSRGRVIASLDDMGNSAAGRLTATYFGSSATVLGASRDGQANTLVTANLPAYTPSGSITNGTITLTNADPSVIGLKNGIGNIVFSGGSSAGQASLVQPTVSQAPSSFTGTAQGGTSTPFTTLPPLLLITTYIKL